MTTYVYEDTEVQLTGRKAKRDDANKKIRGRHVPSIKLLVEIQPVADPSAWKRWVKMEDLYEVVEVEKPAGPEGRILPEGTPPESKGKEWEFNGHLNKE